MKKYYLIFGLIAIIGIFLISGCAEKSCTLEAKRCPDGTSVGRNPDNNCEFDPCPESEEPGLSKSTDPAQFCESDSDCIATSHYVSGGDTGQVVRTGCLNKN